MILCVKEKEPACFLHQIHAMDAALWVECKPFTLFPDI